MAIKNKKGLVFSIISIVISTFLLIFLDSYFFESSFSEKSLYENQRITSIDSEFKYLKNSLMDEYLTKATFRSFEYIFLNDTILNDIRVNNNFEYLNEIVKNLTLTGTYKNNKIIELETTNFNYSFNEYKKSFEENFHLNFDYEIVDYYIEESNPYFLKSYIIINYTIDTFDDVSDWSVVEEKQYDISILGLYDPLFFYNGFNVTLKTLLSRPEDYTWNIDDFKEDVLNNSNMYSYYEANYKYTIGNSFINSLLGKKITSYDNVVFNANFDFDYTNGRQKVFDNSQNNNSIKIYSDVLLYLNFDETNDNLMEHNITIEDLDITNQNCYILNCTKKMTIDLENRELPEFTLMFKFTNSTNNKILQSNVINITHNTNNLLEIDLIQDSKVSISYEPNEMNFLSIKYRADEVRVFLNSELIFSSFKKRTETNLKDKILFDNSYFDDIVLNSVSLENSQILNSYRERKFLIPNYVLDKYDYAFDFKKEHNLSSDLNYDLQNEDYSFLFLIKPKEFNDNNVIDFYDSSGNSFFNVGIKNYMLNISGIEEQIVPSFWYLILLNKENSGSYGVYLNSKKIGSLTISSILDKIVIENYTGLFDEIKFRNKSLEDWHIEDIYYNFNSVEKGCCNYVLLINPNKFGFNETTYSDNVSYDSLMFFDYVNNNNIPNISIFTNISGLTQTDTTKYYHNFKLNYCMGEVFTIATTLILDAYPGEINTSSCYDLIRKGFY